MEIKLSLGVLALLGAIAFGLTARPPIAALSPDAPYAAELAALEDSLAANPADVQVARRLAGEYLRLGRPAFALGVVRAVRPALVVDPLLTHRLAQAYEALGRLDDAAITASVARARCLRALGEPRTVLFIAPDPLQCTPAALVALEQHEQALLQMVRWGVSDPRTDPRARIAHRTAERFVRIASRAE
ncbi:MAG TPA: hypothetical protein VK509_12340 [Polyangiales bacterium]|nr:hypothetical protein [Polyangiales bacterium]